MDDCIDKNIDHLTEELIHSNLAIFAGAGLSIDAGFPSWMQLIEPLAQELGLSLDENSDLLTIAQYHQNDNGNNRSRINDLIKTQFSKRLAPTLNHQVLARLPINTYWTTNYDSLLETALQDAGKEVDVKASLKQLPLRIQHSSVAVFKMHGDWTDPGNAVLTKNDYEAYPIERPAFLEHLKTYLTQKTFLFLGFSFSDPNMSHVLGRLRLLYSENQRLHYWICKRPEQLADESVTQFAKRERQHALYAGDLERYGLKTLWVNSYDEVAALLARIEQRYRDRKSQPTHKAELLAPIQFLVADLPGSNQVRLSDDLYGEESSIAIIKAPDDGTFYHSHKKGGDVYAPVGTRIAKDDIVCQMDIAQEFKAIVAGVAGEIADVLVEDNSRVTKGQSLFVVSHNRAASAKKFFLLRAPLTGTYYSAERGFCGLRFQG